MAESSNLTRYSRPPYPKINSPKERGSLFITPSPKVQASLTSLLLGSEAASVAPDAAVPRRVAR